MGWNAERATPSDTAQEKIENDVAQSGVQRAVQLHRDSTNTENFLSRGSFERKKPQPGIPVGNEVLVRFKMRPINYFDILSLKDEYRPFRPENFPATPGLEGLGEVAAVGDSVTGVQVGDRVVPLLAKYAGRGEGSWQDYVKVDEEDVVLVPDQVGDEAAAQCVVDPLTAMGLIDTLQVPPGEYILQTAAGTSLGRQLIQYAHLKGVKTINVIRRKSESLSAALRELGADEVVSFQDDDLVAQVMAITEGKGVFGAVETGGGVLTKLAARCVRDHGTLVVYGALAGWEVNVDFSELVFRDVRFRGFHFVSWLNDKYPTGKGRTEVVKEVLDLYKDKILVPLIGDKFGLCDYAAAVEAAQKLGRHAKILLVG